MVEASASLIPERKRCNEVTSFEFKFVEVNMFVRRSLRVKSMVLVDRTAKSDLLARHKDSVKMPDNKKIA